jgi:hypothetical protein
VLKVPLMAVLIMHSPGVHDATRRSSTDNHAAMRSGHETSPRMALKPLFSVRLCSCCVSERNEGHLPAKFVLARLADRGEQALVRGRPSRLLATHSTFYLGHEWGRRRDQRRQAHLPSELLNQEAKGVTIWGYLIGAVAGRRAFV